MRNKSIHNRVYIKRILYICIVFGIGFLILFLEPVFSKNPNLFPKINNRCVENSQKFFIPKFNSLFTSSKKIFRIFNLDGSKQCEDNTKKVSIKLIEKKLESKGITVLKSIRGYLKNHRTMAFCGGATGNINIFYINVKHKNIALQNKFQSCSE